MDRALDEMIGSMLLPCVKQRNTILFDLDGTLLDTMELLVASARHAFDGYGGRVPTDAEWLAGVGTPLVTQLGSFATTESDVPKLVERYRAYQQLHHDRLTRCFHDTFHTVRALHSFGYRMGVVTSKVAWLAQRGLDHTGLGPYMHVVVGADHTERHKPHPEPVEFALERLGASAAQALFVGDSPFDMEAGRAAGVLVVAACWGPFSRTELEAAGAERFLRSIGDLPGLLSGLSTGRSTGPDGEQAPVDAIPRFRP